jgi:hypothetical protein
MLRNWANSLDEALAAPSAMLLEIDTAARRICEINP